MLVELGFPASLLRGSGTRDIHHHILGFPGASVVKNPPANAGDEGSNSGSGRSPGGGHGNPLQCSCLGNPRDRGAWRATAQGVAKSQMWLRDTHYLHPVCLPGIWRIRSPSKVQLSTALNLPPSKTAGFLNSKELKGQNKGFLGWREARGLGGWVQRREAGTTWHTVIKALAFVKCSGLLGAYDTIKNS